MPDAVFGHGQLYVALSRSGVQANTKIFMQQIDDTQGRYQDGYITRNVVYKEALV